MIVIDDICLEFGSQKIFDHINANIQQDQRIGLVGLNGSGKSTFLKAVVGDLQLDDGTITIARNQKVAYMPQEVVIASEKSILDEALSVFPWYDLEQEHHKLELLLQENPTDQAIIDRFARIAEQLVMMSIRQDRIEAERVLSGLGFKQLEDPVSSLSVGWKMRIVLAKLLLQQADFYLFDEPTNHLDIVAKDWFLSFLQAAPFGFLLVCHERYFLDHVCDEILELERGEGTFYRGNYTSYEEQKAHRAQLREQAYEQQQKEISRKEATIERFRAKASKARMAKSMEKALDRIERITIPPPPKKIGISFGSIVQSGKTVLTVHQVGYAFGDKKIFEHVSCTIERGERVALIAPNGVGKTTLFQVISGKYPLQQGSITFGHNVAYTVFEQDQQRALSPEKTIIQEVNSAAPKKTEMQVRSFLGAFLFTKDDVLKKTKVLSGGEKNRVSMVKVLLSDANLLLLDEPTNHLDIPSKDILLHALQTYQGTILFVSHDHDFINRLATRIVELTPRGLHSYQGNYESFIYQKKLLEQQQQQSMETEKEKTASPSAEASNYNSFERQKEIKKIEARIAKIEHNLLQEQERFGDLTYGTPSFTKTLERVEELKKQLHHEQKLWEELMSQLT